MGLLTDLLGDGNATYLSTDTPLDFPAGSMSIVGGAPTLGSIAGSFSWGNSTGWLMDAASDETIGAMCRHPGWTTLDIDVIWFNAGAGAGDVGLDTVGLVFSQGTDAGATKTWDTTSAPVVTTAAAQRVVTVTEVASAIDISAVSDYLRFFVRRRAGLAADTLANDIAILGVVLRPGA